MTHESAPRAWVEVDLDAIVHNLHIARKAADGALLMPIVKANAYGHGLELVAKRLDAENIAFFGVANVGEARRLKNAQVRTRPFILGPTLPDEHEEIAANSWGCTVSSVEELHHFEQLGLTYGCNCSLHLAIDTGMGREGFLPHQVPEVMRLLQELPHVRIEGLMSHYSAADEDTAFTEHQAKTFFRASQEVQRHLPLPYIHIAAGAGLIGYPLYAANMARPGLILYGISPMDSPYAQELKPALKLLSRVVLIRELPAGHTISYGHTYTTPHPMRVATIGIGYADGWPRCIAKHPSYVCIQGERCPILGRITMDLIMADVTHLPQAKAGDEVELIGPQLPVTQVAEWAETIPWEVFTGLGVRLPRIPKAHS